jgi:hypothetical protein
LSRPSRVAAVCYPPSVLHSLLSPPGFSLFLCTVTLAAVPCVTRIIQRTRILPPQHLCAYIFSQHGAEDTVQRHGEYTGSHHRECYADDHQVILKFRKGLLLPTAPIARLLQQTMTTSTCRTLPRVRLVAILLHHSKIPRKPSSSNQGQSGPARCARQSRRQLRQPKTSQISQQPCFLAGHPEPAQHARPSRRQLHQPEILRQPCRLVEHSEPAQHARPSRPSRRMRSPLAGRSDPALYARPSRRMRCLLFQLPHVHKHAAPVTRERKPPPRRHRASLGLSTQTIPRSLAHRLRARRSAHIQRFSPRHATGRLQADRRVPPDLPAA